MDCALWLNRRKIYTAAEIAANLDVASLRGYLLAGTLIEWLNEHGGKRYALKLSKLSPDDKDLNGKIAAVFGAKPVNSKAQDGGDRSSSAVPSAVSLGDLAPLSSYPIGSAGSYDHAALSSFGSFTASSLSFGSLSLESVGSNMTWKELRELLFGGGSFSFGSFSFGSGGSFQWEWLYRLLFGHGSFSESSFAFGSFSEWEWEWLYRLLFGYGSFFAGSFAFGSFFRQEWLYRLLFGYGSFSMNSFSFGSFGGITPLLSLPIDEYDLILLKTLAGCPLDRFGYGIHNI